MSTIRELFESTYNIDFINEFLLAKSNNIYGYIDYSDEEFLQAKIRLFEGSFDNNDWCKAGTLSINYLLSILDCTCELAEVKGQDVYRQEIVSALSGIRNYIAIDLPIVCGKQRQWLRLIIKKIDGKNVALIHVSDATAEKTLIEELYLTSYKDGLTGLFNRNTCLLHLSRIDKHAKIHILMIDLDNFKSINDTYGHDYGDYVLKRLGEMLMGIADSNKIFYRLSGDEFLAQVKGCDERQIKEFAEEILDRLSSMQLDNIKLTASIGIIKADQSNQSQRLLNRVDNALYKAKTNKNCYIYDTKL